MMFKREELIEATSAQCLVSNVVDNEFSVSTDTRTIRKGDIYLPLKGANFDGEKFIEQALSLGAVGYFTTSANVFDKADLVLKVEDTKEAYLNLAKFYRLKMDPKTVMITGSSGKTTTKELVYAVLSQKFKTQKTFSNHNNEIGFCQTVLGMSDDTEALVVEAGMRGLGEIELISTHLMPDFAIITNSGTAHIGRLGSLENIAKAKCEIAAGLNSNGAIISLNQDIIKENLKYCGKKIFYSLDDVNVLERKIGYSKFEYKDNIYELNVEGDYNIENSLAAIELGYCLGLTYDEIHKGLMSYKPIEKRWEIENVSGINFINDSYNANPDSMKASVKTFIELYEKPVVVLGNMGELGENEIQYHREVGLYLSKLRKDVRYLLVGDLASEIGNVLAQKGFKVESFENTKQVASAILETCTNGETVFLKASRSMEFEKIIEIIRGIK